MSRHFRERTSRTGLGSYDTDPSHMNHYDTPDEDERSRTALEELQQKVDALEHELASANAAKADLHELRARLQRTTDNLRRVQARKSVRWALAVAGQTTRVRRLAHLPRDWRARIRQRRTLATIGRSRDRIRRTSGPLVTIVIPTRNGAEVLRRCLRGLRRKTTYRSFEVVVVDNASTDDTAGVIRSSGVPATTIVNETNHSFSESCNQGARQSDGDYILFLNNDVEPLSRTWLGDLVTALEEDADASIAGALLMFPLTIDAGDDSLNSTVQHRGVSFGWLDGAPRGVHIGRGDSAADPSLMSTRTVPAVTAATMLVEREAFERVGGFDSRYFYGWEDIDLCLRMNEAGRKSIFVGSVALIHNESATQRVLGDEFRGANHAANSTAFWDRWGPELSFRVRASQLEGTGFWTATADRLVAILVTSSEESDGFGDLYTGIELATAFADAGWTAELVGKRNGAWPDIPEHADVIVALLPDFRPDATHRNAFCIAWTRNWVDRWLANPSIHRYDLVAAASEQFVSQITRHEALSTVVLPLATNPDRFYPDPDALLVRDIAIVANRWGGARGAVDLLEPRPDEVVELFGKGWEDDERAKPWWKGHRSYADLPDIYRTSGIVIDDTVEPNLPAVNARVFDALASGTLVISNNREGSSELFDGKLPTYTDRDSLRALLDEYSDRSEAQGRSAELREHVTTKHTYQQRVSRLTETAIKTATAPRVTIRTGASNRTVAHRWGDTHFANQLATSLARCGTTTRVVTRDEWYAPRVRCADVVLHLRGLHPSILSDAQVNVMWMISHPDDVSDRECEQFDAVFVASSLHADALSRRIETPVIPMFQATDGSRIRPPTAVNNDRVVFVGNSRGVRRPIVDWALGAGLNLEVYGSGWNNLIPAHVIRADYVPNEVLGDLYASAAVVLNDHWADMAEKGFVSNRVLDALAAGSFVVTDRIAGLDQLVGGAVPTCASADELATIARTYINDIDSRVERVRAGQHIVAANHTFDHRAAEIAQIVNPLVADLRSRWKLTGPKR